MGLIIVWVRDKVRAIFGYRWVGSIILLFLLDFCTYMAFGKLDQPRLVDNQDKYLHTLAFITLSVMGYLALAFDVYGKLRRISIRLLLFNWFAWLSYGGFLELGQLYLAHREASLGDMLADSVGIALGTVLVVVFQLHPPPLAPDLEIDQAQA